MEDLDKRAAHTSSVKGGGMHALIYSIHLPTQMDNDGIGGAVYTSLNHFDLSDRWGVLTASYAVTWILNG